MDLCIFVELIFDQGLGDIFSICIVGNVLNEDIFGSMEYVMKVVGLKIIVVLGYICCGVIGGVCDFVKLGNLIGLFEKIQLVIDQEIEIKDECNSQNEEFVICVIKFNVQYIIDEICEKSLIIIQLEKEGFIFIVGGLYDFDLGLVEFF